MQIDKGTLIRRGYELVLLLLPTFGVRWIAPETEIPIQLKDLISLLTALLVGAFLFWRHCNSSRMRVVELEKNPEVKASELLKLYVPDRTRQDLFIRSDGKGGLVCPRCLTVGVVLPANPHRTEARRCIRKECEYLIRPIDEFKPEITQVGSRR